MVDVKIPLFMVNGAQNSELNSEHCSLTPNVCCVMVLSFVSLQCFDTVVWVTGRAFVL